MIFKKKKSDDWLNIFKIGDKVKLIENIHVRSDEDSNRLEIEESNDRKFYNWYEKGEEFTYVSRLWTSYVLENNYKNFILILTKSQLINYFIKINKED